MNYKGNDKYGALPRRTVIANQPHMLAYINPQEEMLLRQLGGTGQPGPMGVPAYPPGDGGFSPDGGGGYGGGGGFGGFGGSEGGGGGGYDSGYVDPGLAVAAAQAAAQQQAAANAAAMAAADAAIAEQMAAAAQEEANAAAMAEAEAAITFDIPTVTPNVTPVNPYAIDIQDTNIYTPNDDGTYSIEDGELDPEPGFDPDEYLGGPGDGEGGETTTNKEVIDPTEYFNLFRSTQPSSWLANSIYNSYGSGPSFDVDVYQEADGSLRFRDGGQLVPEEYLKYIDNAKRTEMTAPGEEEA